MNSIAIGDQLKAAREARGLSIDYVAGETNIAKRYIAAMELEDFSVFPGDPYIVGFLRNYAEYLGIDSNSIVQAFRGIRIQEQPVPLQELLQPKSLPVWPFVVAALVAAIGIGTFLVLVALDKKAPVSVPEMSRTEPVKHTLSSASFEKRLYKGDTILVPYEGQTYRLSITAIDDRVAIETPVGPARFMLGEEASIDLDKDNQPELVAFIVDFQKNDESKGAVIRFTAKGILASSLQSPGTATAASDAAQTTPPATAPDQAVPVATQTTGADRPTSQESIVFTGKRSPHPFVVNVTFRNYAMFRHEIDRKDREERYYHKGEQISVTANNSAKLWTSNAAACKLTIQASGGQSVDVDLGTPGEVAVKQIRWTQADDSTWSLGVYNVN
jgi:cytoskeletal protein RodZ